MWTNKIICCRLTWPISNELPVTVAVDLDHMISCVAIFVPVHTMPCAIETNVPEVESLGVKSKSAAVVFGCSEFYPVNGEYEKWGKPNLLRIKGQT